MQLAITPALFESFGDINYLNSCQSNRNFIRNASHDEEGHLDFKKICSNILLSETDFNLLEFHNLVFHITNKNTMKVSNLLIEVFDEVTQQIKNDIDKLVLSGSFTLQSFVNSYNTYLTNSLILSKYLTYFDNRVQINNSSKYSYVGLIRKYMFYRNVINCQYGDQGYLYEILRKLVESANMADEQTVNVVKQLFKMYSFYNRMSFTPKKNKDELFNSQIDKLFLASLGSNQEFVKTISHYLHNCIKQIKKSDKVSLDNISNLINLISTNFTERDMFNMYYEKLLELRLLNNEYQVEVELELINNFCKPKDNKIIQNMLHKIEDIQKSIADDIVLHTKIDITVTPDSDKKYKNKVDISKINLKILTAKVFRNYAWSYSRSEENDKMIVPFDLAPYVDIYNQYYKVKYPHRNLDWNFNYGTGVTKVKLGQKHYYVQLNTAQMFLLLQFNQQEKITALELASNLGIPMPKLGKILNSFLKSKILSREQTKQSSDPSMLIFLNQNFHCDSDKISLIGLMNQTKINDTEIHDRFAIGKENLLQASIVRLLKKYKELTIDELLTLAKSNVSFPFTQQQFKTCLDTCKSEGYLISNDDNIWKYVEDTE